MLYTEKSVLRYYVRMVFADPVTFFSSSLGFSFYLACLNPPPPSFLKARVSVILSKVDSLAGPVPSPNYFLRSFNRA